MEKTPRTSNCAAKKPRLGLSSVLLGDGEEKTRTGCTKLNFCGKGRICQGMCRVHDVRVRLCNSQSTSVAAALHIPAPSHLQVFLSLLLPCCVKNNWNFLLDCVSKFLNGFCENSTRKQIRLRRGKSTGAKKTQINYQNHCHRCLYGEGKHLSRIPSEITRREQLLWLC